MVHRELIHFHTEIERGCTYTVENIIYHRATKVGIIQEPSFEETEVWVDKEGKVHRMKYQSVPVHAFKDNIFDIQKGEIGDLLMVGIRDDSLEFCKVRWKHATDIYYHNPVRIQIASDYQTKSSIEKIVTLEELFTVIKKEPKKKKD